MSLWFHDTVSALVYSLAQPHAGSPDTELQPPYNDLAQFVLRQRAQMPDFLRVPLIAATLGFDLLGCLRNGRLFHRRQPTSHGGSGNLACGHPTAGARGRSSSSGRRTWRRASSTWWASSRA